jgi:hypothetical protein
MGEIVIAAYRPLPGQEEALRALVKEHLPLLRERGLVTERPAWVMRASDGTLLEVFEWKSAQAVERAHQDAAVQALWERFGQVCTFVKLAELAEAQEPFKHFTPVEP